MLVKDIDELKEGDSILVCGHPIVKDAINKEEVVGVVRFVSQGPARTFVFKTLGAAWFSCDLTDPRISVILIDSSITSNLGIT